MQPDRSNYEIWFIDWLDGKLSEDRIEQLKVFLAENPDLQEELESLGFLKLTPPVSQFRGKEQLKKTAGDYSDSQFDYLSVAFLEKDLTPEQLPELQELITSDDEKRKLFELTQKLKLTPPGYGFSRKAILKKLTIGQKAIRFSAIGLSAAAVIAFMVFAFSLFREKTERTIQQQAFVETKTDTLLIAASDPVNAGNHPGPVTSKTENVKASSAKVLNNLQGKEEQADEPGKEIVQDSLSHLRSFYTVSPLAVNYPSELYLSGRPSEYVLAAYNPGIIPPLYDPYNRRSNVDRFLARFFHEIIMRDKKSGDRPVEPFELADAGIKGLNKLFGWQMVLQENNDTLTDAKTYRFSSRLVRIKTPIKKISDIL